MLVLVNKDELRVLKKELRSCFPESLKVHGAVLNVCQGNAFHQEILVDSWPSFQVVIARLQREKVPSEMNYFTQSCAVFYKDLNAYEKLVKDSDAIDWKQEFLLQGKTPQHPKFCACAKCVYFSKLFQHWSGSELKLSSLNTAHAALLNETWSVGGNEQSLCYLTRLIDCFSSSCLLDAGGCPISWVLLDQFGCLTHAYTMPAHRGKGYIQLVIAALGRKLQSLNYPVYGDVLENNTSMQRALQCLGANFTSCFLSYDLHTPISLL
uniref:Glycine N-acyltransferase-like protein n=1 Tax=Podarcis muralis TaxID=64176 RepID=A0A670JBD1_PODMU